MRRLQKAISLAAFLIALATYWLTADSGASYWDCPEYLLTALKLEVGHPPGNPGWSLFHRVATSLFTDPATQARVVNMMSGVFTALAVMLLCSLSITTMRMIWNVRKSGKWRSFAICASSLAGSLCFAWSDSAWYSAVEAEVYAMSLFLTALTVWMSVKWAFARSSGARSRWMIGLAYVIGFSLGVHQLNLLALPAIAMIMLFGARRNRKAGFLRTAGAFLGGCIAVLLILKGLMPGSLSLVVAADVFAVNTFGWQYWTGALAAWSLAFAVAVGLAVAITRRHRTAGTALWCVAAVMLGYSVYIIIPIRAWANPPVNEGNPSSVSRFADYLDRRQYGQSPLFYGKTPYSKIMRLEKVTVKAAGDTAWDYSRNVLKVLGKDWRPVRKGDHIPSRSGFLTDKDKALNARLSADSTARGYAVAGFKTRPVYTPELDMFLPRIHSSAPDDILAYGDWTGMDSASMTQVTITEAFDSLGNPVGRRNADGSVRQQTALRPTYLQSLTYLVGYQMGYMYFRYLLWNFAGRQNDVPSTGEIDHGNFITGIPPVDDLMLGSDSSLPRELKSGNAGRNKYWCIPFIVGILGIIWLFSKGDTEIGAQKKHRVAWVSLMLFLMTGLAIVAYLNQTPGEPRERDYSFLGSFAVFSFWIGCGLLWLLRIARRRVARGAAIALALALPFWMLAENWDDHDRSGRSATLDYAENLLQSLDRDAVIFVDGDNFIFPLWFAQEAMGIRRDVTVVCLSFLGSEWYVEQLMTPRYGHEGLRMTATAGDIALGNYNLFRFPSSDADTMPATDALRAFYRDMSPTATMPARTLAMGRDSLTRWHFDLLSIPGKSPGATGNLRDLAMIDIIATNYASRYPRPIYWQQNLRKDKYGGFHPYTRQALFTRKLTPTSSDSVPLTEESLNALPNLKWGGIERMAYPGPDVALHAAQQRSSLIRLAEALADEGRHDQALHVMRLALVRFPQRIIPFDIKSHGDSAYFEGPIIGRLLVRCGEETGDTAAVKLGNDILKSERQRTREYRKYLKKTPKSRRHAISPTSRNHSL